MILQPHSSSAFSIDSGSLRLSSPPQPFHPAPSHAVIFLLLVLLGAGFGLPQDSEGDAPAALPAPAHQSWAWQMEELTRWLAATRGLVPRTEDGDAPAFLLDRLTLTGSLQQNQLQFTLTGFVVSRRPQLVPLFGPPSQVQLRRVTLNDRPAAVGFADCEHYFVRTAERAFTIRGELALGSDSSLAIPGPLNSLTADLADGRVVEGRQLSGIQGLTLHLERGRRPEAGAEAKLPPVFQVARALRIQKEITFEYRVTLRSGTEIAGITLPLPYGETVLDVPGKPGWRQEGARLTVPTAGRSVEFTAVGRLPRVGAFRPDERSAYEWWLIESDSEHRVGVETNARQVDAAESPIGRRLPSARLFLVSKGHSLQVRVQPLGTLDALVAVARVLKREVVWTPDGDLVAQDKLGYENNGLDYLSFDVRGRPVYFSADGVPAKLLSADPRRPSEIQIPLQTGSHGVEVQSISRQRPGWLGGILRVPTSKHGLMASRETVILGLPDRIIPLWFTGGDGWFNDWDLADTLVLVLNLILGLGVSPAWRLRIAAFIGLTGLYLVSTVIYSLLIIFLLAVVLLLSLRERIRGRLLHALLVILALILLVGIIGPSTWSRLNKPMKIAQQTLEERKFLAMLPKPPAPAARNLVSRQAETYVDRAASSPQFYTYFDPGMTTVRGITPIALTMPESDSSVSVSRELVSRARPLEPVLVYVTFTALWPFILLWLASIAYLLWNLRDRLDSLFQTVRGWFRKPPTAQAATASPSVP